MRQILLKYSNRSSNLLTNDDYVELSKYTTRIVKYPQILPIVLHAIALHDCQTYNNFIKELQSLYLQRIPLETAMELLDFEYTDTAVRNLAVWQLEQLNSYDLRTFTIQLVQSLKFERSTELFKYLVTQAVNNFKEFGFDFYWALRSEMKHSLAHGQIYKLMLIKILLGISETDRKDLLKTEQILQSLAHITKAVSNVAHSMKGKCSSAQIKYVQKKLLDSQLERLNKQLLKIAECDNIPYFKLPFSYTVLLDQFVIDKSKIMDSKKAPLMLFIHKYGLGQNPTYVGGLIASYYTTMFKTGDDLRQDQLVIQTLEVLNNLWLSNSMDLKMKLYKVVPTGPLEGMIEIVVNSATMAKITQMSGGAGKAFSKKPLVNWLLE